MLTIETVFYFSYFSGFYEFLQFLRTFYLSDIYIELITHKKIILNIFDFVYIFFPAENSKLPKLSFVLNFGLFMMKITLVPCLEVLHVAPSYGRCQSRWPHASACLRE